MIPGYLKRPKYAVLGALLLLALGAVFLLPKKGSWVPEADCGTPALITPGDRVVKGAKVYWAATGPVGTYVIAVGVSKLAVDAEQKVTVAEAQPGVEPITGLTDLAGCVKSGSIDGVLAAGEYTLRLFRIDGSTVVEVASRGFRVQS